MVWPAGRSKSSPPEVGAASPAVRVSSLGARINSLRDKANALRDQMADEYNPRLLARMQVQRRQLIQRIRDLRERRRPDD